MIKKIAFDIDGTMTEGHFDFMHFFLERYKKDFGKPYPGKIHTNEYRWEKIFPDVDEDYVIKVARDFSRRPDCYRPYIKELFNTLHNMGIEIHIITARGTDPCDCENITEITKSSLKEAGIYYDELHIGFSDKVNIMKATGCELIVEDSKEQVPKLAEFFPVLIVDHPYNKNVSGMNIWRITGEDFKPDIFIDKIKYVMNHLEGLFGDEYDFTGDDLFTFRKNIIIANAKNIKSSNILFVMSAREKPVGTEVLCKYIKQHVKKGIILDLSQLTPAAKKEKSMDVKGDELIRASLRKHTDHSIDLNNTESTQAYVAKTETIKELLKYANTHKDTTFIFDGVESFMLSRADLENYEKCPVFFTDCSDREIALAKSKTHVKKYNAFLFMEDLTEVSTQLRKWRIIAGTAKKELPHYINRQWCDSEGVDRVSLLKGEKAYRPDLLEAILSENTWIVGDLHLSTKDPAKTKNIIRNISKKVGRNEHLIIIGDLDGKKGTGSYELTKKTLSKLPTKNIYLILGNNDPYAIEDYVKCGFKSVVDMAVFQPSSAEKIILTHCPVPVSGDEVNIHGHIHGSKIYWNVDWQNHYDVWDQDYYPIRIKDCLEKIRNGEYVAKSENHKRY